MGRGLIAQLMIFARPNLRRTQRSIDLGRSSRRIEIIVDMKAAQFAISDSMQLEQAVLNLCINARNALEGVDPEQASFTPHSYDAVYSLALAHAHALGGNATITGPLLAKGLRALHGGIRGDLLYRFGLHSAPFNAPRRRPRQRGGGIRSP